MRSIVLRIAVLSSSFVLLAAPGAARGHCDGLDGPVVTSAKRALEKGDVKLVLPWVKADAEPEIREAFQRTLSVRKAGGEARALADTWFFETLVRVHRAGEGAPYTGLKPAGRDLGPAIPAADAALETGKPQLLVKLLADATHAGLHERYLRAAAARKDYAPGDVEAGRRFVAAYVDYLHYVERVYAAATKGGAHGERETAALEHHD